MSRRDIRLFLADMLESIAKIERYTEGMDFADFVENELVTDAVVRNLEVIGEAARQIPEEVRGRYPAIPWRRVVGLRNIVVHEYFAVDLEVVWAVVRENLPPLKQALQGMLEDLESA